MGKPRDNLPDEIVPPAGAKQIAWTIAGVALFLVLVNQLISPLEIRTNRGYWLIEQKWSMLAEAGKPVDLLVLGDSSGNQAVMPSVLRANLGASALNLCTFGDMTVANDAWMLEEYITTHGPPRKVVAVHVHDVWPRPINLTNVALIPRAWGFWDGHQPGLGLTRKDKASLALRRYLPLYARISSMSKLIQTPIEAFEPVFALERDGFMPVDAKSDLAAQTRRYLEFVRANRFKMSTTNRDALVRMIELSDQHGFDFYLAEGPKFRPLMDDPAFREYLGEMQRELGALIARGRRSHLLFREPVQLDAEFLEGVDHVNTRGAPIYSARLAEAIAAAAPAPEAR